MRVNGASREALRERPHERLPQRLHHPLVVADVSIIEVVCPPDVFRLAVDGSVAFERNVFQVLAVNKRALIVGCGVLGCEQCGPSSDKDADVAAKVEGAGGELAGREIDRAAADARG